VLRELLTLPQALTTAIELVKVDSGINTQLAPHIIEVFEKDPLDKSLADQFVFLLREVIDDLKLSMLLRKSIPLIAAVLLERLLSGPQEV
jgi:hypothetical protein